MMKFRQSAWAGGALLVLLTALAYLPALRAGFIWDDDSLLTNSAIMRSSGGIKDIWFSTNLPDYYPLTWSSLWLEWRLWGMNAMGYHITNLLLHIFSALLWWRILKLLAIPGAWLAALIFAVHPVNVESVIWISERKNTLSMFFYTLAVWWYQRFEVEQNPTQGETGNCFYWRWYGLSLLAFLFALWCKTSVVMFPVVLLLCAWWRRGGISRRDLLQSAPFFGLALVWGLVTIWFQYYSAHSGEDVATRSFGARLAGAGMAAWFYLWKAVWPGNLAFVYPQWKINAGSPLVYLPFAAWVLCFGMFWRWRGGWGKPLLFGLGYFVVTLLPVLGLLKIYFQRYSLVADYWQYFSIIGVGALIVGAVNRYLASTGKFMLVGRGLGALVVGVLCILTWRQCGVYRDTETLWRDTLAKNPTCSLAHNNLGIILATEKEPDEAIEHFHAAIRYKTMAAEAHVNLGIALADQRKFDEAIAHYREALRIDPNNAAAHLNLGSAFLELGRLKDAEGEFTAALKFKHAPWITETHTAMGYYNLANVLDREGRREEAVRNYREAIRIDRGFAEAHNNLGNILLLKGELDEAIAQFRAAIQYKTNYANAHSNLAVALAGQGRFAEAIPHYTEALRLDPDSVFMHNNLGFALMEMGRLDEAEGQFAAALRLNPNAAEAHFNLGVVLAGQHKFEQAITQYREALRLKPDYAEAKEQLRALGVQITE